MMLRGSRLAIKVMLKLMPWLVAREVVVMRRKWLQEESTGVMTGRLMACLE